MLLPLKDIFNRQKPNCLQTQKIEGNLINSNEGGCLRQKRNAGYGMLLFVKMKILFCMMNSSGACYADVHSGVADVPDISAPGNSSIQKTGNKHFCIARSAYSNGSIFRLQCIPLHITRATDGNSLLMGNATGFYIS